MEATPALGIVGKEALLDGRSSSSFVEKPLLDQRANGAVAVPTDGRIYDGAFGFPFP